MSVLIHLTIPCDTDKFLAVAAEQADKMVAISEYGKSLGAIHHRFGIGDGEIVVIDEWDSAESFQGFFDGNEEIASLMQDAGATGPPAFTIYEAIESPDAF